MLDRGRRRGDRRQMDRFCDRIFLGFRTIRRPAGQYGHSRSDARRAWKHLVEQASSNVRYRASAEDEYHLTTKGRDLWKVACAANGAIAGMRPAGVRRPSKWSIVRPALWPGARRCKPASPFPRSRSTPCRFRRTRTTHVDFSINAEQAGDATDQFSDFHGHTAT